MSKKCNHYKTDHGNKTRYVVLLNQLHFLRYFLQLLLEISDIMHFAKTMYLHMLCNSYDSLNFM